MSVVSQFMTSPCDSYWDAVVRILQYIKSAPGKGLLFEDQGHKHITGYTDIGQDHPLIDVLHPNIVF